MKLECSRALITGAAGGIGSATAARLAAAGVRLLLADLRPAALEELADGLRRGGADVVTIAADITIASGRQALAERARETGVDVFINVAGVNPFGLLTQQTPEEIERALTINTVAPILLCRALMPVLANHAEAHIVNVGSTFGSIGFPGFCVYSASKFALRGFTEGLRRELARTSIRVHYVAPRATRTALVTDAVRAMNEELGIGMDTPDVVAAAIEQTLQRGRHETYLGAAEKLFVVINGLFPRIVDRSLRKQLPIIERHAAAAHSSPSDSNRPPVHLQFAGAKQ